MINIDKYAYISKLKNTAPMKKLIFSLLTLGVCLWAGSVTISVLVILTMGWTIIFKGCTPFRTFIKLMLIPISFLVIGVLPIGINISGDKSAFLFSMHSFGLYIGVSQSSIQNVVNLFFKTLGAVSCLYYLSLSTPIVDLLAVLRRLKFPKLMIELMGLIYRFIFVLIETADTMFMAQNSRLGYSSLSTAYRSMASLILSLFIRAYKRSEDIYTALEARGYDGELNVLEEKFETYWTEYIAPVSINLFFIIVALLLKQYTGGLL